MTQIEEIKEIYSPDNFKKLILSWNSAQTGTGQTIRITRDGGRVTTIDYNKPDINGSPFPVSPEQIERLLAYLEKMDFMNLEPVYKNSALDVTGYYVSLEMDGQELRGIEYDVGLFTDLRKPDYPKGLFELEKIVTKIAWIEALKRLRNISGCGFPSISRRRYDLTIPCKEY